MPLIPLDALDDPRLHVYSHLKKTNQTRWSGLYITEGKKLTLQLLGSGLPVQSALVSDRHVDQVAGYADGPVPIFVLPHALCQLLVGFSFHCGMLGCGERWRQPELAELLPGRRRHLLVVCPKTENPDNIGALVRIAAGFGATALLLGSGCADPFLRRSLRVSMGNALQLPILECGAALRERLVWLRDSHGFELIATVLDPMAEPLRNVRCPQSCAILLGNEDAGLAAEWVDLATRRVTIPMNPGTDSLNVAVAAGIFLHHFATPDPAA